MLKGFQILGSSSSFFSQKWRSGNGSSLSFISASNKFSPPASLFPFSSSSRSLSPTLLSTSAAPIRKTGPFRAFRMSASCPESAPDGLSSSSSSSVAVQQSGNPRKINFCQWCGGPTKHEIPDGEEKMRPICTKCGGITYQNPKMEYAVGLGFCGDFPFPNQMFGCELYSMRSQTSVVGCLIEHENKVLLCKRNIQPSYGLWTLPAGYLEIGESAVEGAMRETWEEAGAEVEVLSPFAQLDIPLIGQTYVIFLAKLKKPRFSPGPESLECRLYALDDIPFDSLAFSSMVVTLNLYVEDMRTGRLKFHYGTINKRPGTSPSDIHAYSLDYHMEC